MNQRTVLGIALVFVVITFTQCTVQKRLYRKGYYISFNKTPKSSGEPKEEKQLANLPVADSVKIDVAEPEETSVVQAELSESTASSATTVSDEPTTSFGVKSLVNRAKSTTQSLMKQVVSDNKKALDPAEKKQPRHARTAILVVTLLMIVAGLSLFAIGVSSLNPYAAIGGIVLTLGALIGLCIALAIEDAVSSSEKTEEEKRVKKEKEQKLSEEDWNELKRKQYQKAVRTTILLVVLFFAVSLFAIAIGEALPLIVITGAMFLIFLAFVWGTYKAKRKDDPVDAES